MQKNYLFIQQISIKCLLTHCPYFRDETKISEKWKNFPVQMRNKNM